jgi:hypothetical protein
MINVAGLIDLDENTVKALTEASTTKASALREARDFVAQRFAGQSRISYPTLLSALDSQVADYVAAGDASYWTVEGQEKLAAQKREAEKAATPEPTPAPEATPDAGQPVVAETPAEDKPRRGGRNA